MGIFADSHIFARHYLSQGKVAFGNSFVWILSISRCVQNLIKISHMVEDLRRVSYFHIFTFLLFFVVVVLPYFGFGVALLKKSSIWQVYWLDLVGIRQYAKHYQNIPHGFKRYDHFLLNGH